MKPDTYREHLNDLQVEVEELRAKLKASQTGDFISRQAALSALASTAGVGNRALDKIRALPSAQPEIVRCKDCKWFHDMGCAIRIVDESDEPKEEDYCSFAERRTE